MKTILTVAVLMAMGGGAYAAEFGELAVNASGLKASAAAEDLSIPAVPRGYAAGSAHQMGVPPAPIEWVTINGGRFILGADYPGYHFEDTKPAHKVTIKTFEMSKTAVTVEQYAECVNKKKCEEPETRDWNCNWGKPGKEQHPINCVDWDQANQYARFKGARLPSEAEWEYAARSGGRDQKYPWGNEEPSCDRVVFYGNGSYGCGTGGTMPVCSKLAGNTAQGLCDMAGNVAQWVQDQYHYSYKGAPNNGSAFITTGEEIHSRVVRGGFYYFSDAWKVQVNPRDRTLDGSRFPYYGIRLVRGLRQAGRGGAEDKGYAAFCSIKGGEALGVIRNLSREPFRYSGSVSFYFYNDEGALIDQNLSMESGTIRPSESKILVNSGIPLRAVGCAMDISSAVRQ